MAVSDPACSSQHRVDVGKELSTKRLDMCQQNDQPCDVTLMVKGGKQFKVHGNVLSKASSFFEKMLDSDWKESSEGVIRLQSVTDEIMEDILEFVYFGSVHVGSVERAEDLITAAD